GEREQDVVDPGRGHTEMLEGLPQQPAHQRNALRVHRQPGVDRDVHGSPPPRRSNPLPSLQKCLLTRESFVLFDVQRTTLADRPTLTVRGELDIATAHELAVAGEGELARRA